MTLDALHITDFQSLRDVSVGFGRFTVIVGPSSSGKSALMRAIKTLASNSRGTPYVSHGAKRTRISATFSDTSVALERGTVRGGEGYFVAVGRAATPEDNDHAFTKLGGTVPEEITKLVGIDPIVTGSPSLHFAGQFDAPFLLTETGGDVARRLGQLTNVDLIFSASRESNRRRLESGGQLKTRKADLAALTDGIQRFKNLRERMAALDESEQHLLAAERISDKITRLTDLLATLEVAEGAVERAAAKRTAAEPPDLTELEAAADRLGRFKVVLQAVQTTGKALTTAAGTLEVARTAETALEAELVQTLHEAGTCPTCGQTTQELAHAA